MSLALTKEEIYLRALSEWNRTHKIVGQKPINELFEESKSAVASALAADDGPKSSCMVDIGAGNGLLGMAWLLARAEHKVIFTEPDPKKAAFLVKVIALDLQETKRAKTFISTIEAVSRETFEQFAGASGYFLSARAFSGAKGLEAALREGGHLPAPVWVFSGTAPSSGQNKENFYLKRLLFT